MSTTKKRKIQEEEQHLQRISEKELIAVLSKDIGAGTVRGSFRPNGVTQNMLRKIARLGSQTPKQAIHMLKKSTFAKVDEDLGHMRSSIIESLENKHVKGINCEKMSEVYKKEKQKLELQMLKHNRKYGAQQQIIGRVKKHYGDSPTPQYKFKQYNEMISRIRHSSAGTGDGRRRKIKLDTDLRGADISGEKEKRIDEFYSYDLRSQNKIGSLF